MQSTKMILSVLTLLASVSLVADDAHPAVITWNGEGDGSSWHDPNNWDLDRVPDAGDDVVIPDVTGTSTVSFSAGTASINSLFSEERLVFSSGVLDVATTVQVNNEFIFTGDTLKNATVLPGTAGEGILINGSGGTFINVTLESDISFGHNEWIWLRGGLTLNGTAEMTHKAGLGGFTGFAFVGGNQTLEGSGEVLFASGGDNNSIWMAADTLIIGENILVSGGSGTLGRPSGFISSVIVRGTVQVDGAGQCIGFHSTGGWVNEGTLVATNGGTLLFRDTWQNLGTVSLTDASLELDGTFTADDVGSVSRTNSAVKITGTLNNQGRTLAFDATTGSWTLSLGTIVGGTITGADGEGLLIPVSTFSSGILDSVTLDLDIDFPASAWIGVRNGLTLNGVARLFSSGGFTGFSFGGTQVLDGTGAVVFETNAVGSATGNFVWSGSGTLTIGPDVVISGGGGSVGGDGSIINQGLIQVDAAGETIAITATSWTNKGTIAASNGAILTFDGDWNNVGTVAASQSTVNLDGTFTVDDLGTFNRNGGTVNLTGTLDNQSNTLAFDATTGSWNLAGGTINGGAIVGSAGEGLIPTASVGTLSGVTVNLDLSFQNSAWLNVRNGIHLNGSATLLAANHFTGFAFRDNQSLAGTGEIFFGSNSSQNSVWVDSGDTLSIGENVRIHGGGGTVGASNASFINGGIIEATESGQTITLSGTGWVNEGNIEAVNGAVLSAQGTWSTGGTILIDDNSEFSASGNYIQTGGETLLNNGTLIAAGTVDLQAGSLSGPGDIEANVRSSGDVNPGGSPGILNITKNYTQRSGGILNIEIGGLSAGTEFDQFNITNNDTLDGTLNISLINSFVPSPGDSFEVMTYGSRDSAFVTITGMDLGGGLKFMPIYTDTSLILKTQEVPGVTVTWCDIALSGPSGSQDTVFVCVDDVTGKEVISYQLVVTFDTSVLDAVGATSMGTISESFGPPTVNTTVPGQITVGGFGASPLADSGPLVALILDVVGAPGDSTNLCFESVLFNTGDPVAGIPAPCCSYEVLVGADISGTVTYCPTGGPVPDVILTLSGATSGTDTTDANGDYLFEDLHGGLNYTVSPFKEDDIGLFSITCFDAALIAREAVGLDPSNHCDSLAADVDENGFIQTFDAALTCRFAVGLPPFGESDHTGEWRFEPASRSYTPLVSSQLNEDYVATLLGDKDGNWTPASGGSAPSVLGKGEASHISFAEAPEWSEDGKEMTTGLHFNGGPSALSFELNVSYDATDLKYKEAKSALAGWQVIVNSNQEGRLRLGMYSTTPLVQASEFVRITWEVLKEGERTQITLDRALVNEEVQPAVELSTELQSLLPTEFALHQNYPNPFNPETKIRFDIPKVSDEEVQARLSIYNVSGQLVRPLLEEKRAPGSYEIEWDGRNEGGVPVPSGVYFYTLTAGDFKASKKMLVLR